MLVYIAVFGGLFIFSFVVLLLSSYGIHHDAVRSRVSNVLNNVKEIDFLDDELSKPIFERFIKPVINSIYLKIKKVIPKNLINESCVKRQQNEKLKKMLRQAGLNINVSEYSFLRVIVIISAAILFGMIAILLKLGVLAVFGVLIGIYAGYVIMRFYLTSKISKRRKSMEQQLPDVLDLLSINVEAGLGFEQALLNVIGHFEGPLIDEFTITYREMTMGRARREALTLFAERCGLNEIKTFAGAVVQAEHLGISMKNVLRTQASAMRINRKNKVEEKAMKVSVKILFPMVVFIFPVLFIVLMGPAAVKIINQFKG